MPNFDNAARLISILQSLDRQLGNAVAVPCVEWITRRIVKAADDEERAHR